MNFVFENVNEDTYKEIKSILCSNFESRQNENIAYCLDALKLTSPEKSLSVKYYKSKKLMLQGNFNGIDELIATIQEKTNIKTKDIVSDISSKIQKTSKEILIGFDESGKGETFGSMFVCGIRFEVKDLAYINGIIQKKDIKKLNKNQIDGLFNLLKDRFSYEIIQVSPNEIDSYPLNILLDRKYVLLLDKLTNEFAKESIIIDDYGVGYELVEKLKELKKSGSEIIVENSADIKYSACAIASLVARRTRLLDMERLSGENIIIDLKNGEKISFESGSPSNSETEKISFSL